MPLALPWLQDRWERQLHARGGYKKKRSGRFTKPGLRLRAAEEVEAEIEPVDVPSGLEVRDYVPGRLYTPTGWGTSYTVSNNTTLTTTNTNTLWYNSSSTSTGTGIWTTDGTAAWVVPATTVVYDQTYDGTGINIPLAQLSPEEQRNMQLMQLTPEQIAEIERTNRRNEFQARIRAQVVEGPAPYTDRRRHADFTNVSQPEIVALQLLKKMLPVEEWRRYLRYGFIMVHSRTTGLDYQIFRSGGHIRVFRHGKDVAELCIHISDRKCPPTDRVIAKKIMLECTETEVWAKSNIHCCQLSQFNNPTEDQLIQLVS